MIQWKRVYEAPERADGCRVLVDRLWRRGLPREKVRIDEWRKDLAPSDALRRWFGHEDFSSFALLHPQGSLQ